MPTTLGIVAAGRTAPTTYNPLLITWAHAMWTGDPGQTPPTDGAAADTWRNAGNPTFAWTAYGTGTGPIYRAAYSGLNSKPAIEFNVSNSRYYRFASVAPNLTQPNDVVCIGWLATDATAQATIYDSNGDRSFLRQHGAGAGVTQWAGAGTNYSTSGVDGPFIIIARYDAASSKIWMNGTSVTAPSSPAASGVGGVIFIGAEIGAGEFFKGAVAFFGIKDTALTAQEITDLQTWAKNYYGAPVP